MSTTALSAVQEYSDPTVVANLMNEQRFNRMMIIAQTMASASLIPDHLLGKKKGQNFEYFTADEIRANCFLIVNQAFRWGMDPFAVMPETYVVGGKLGYQGKLIAGLVNSMADLEERLSYAFKGTKGNDDFTVIVSGKFRGAKEPVTVEVSVGQAKTDNQMWRKDPEQKLVYSGATKWARRWCPEIILGIMTDDDSEQMEMRDVTPQRTEPVKVITGGAAPAVDTAAPPKTPRKTKAEAAAPVEATGVADSTATGVATCPPRSEMVNAIRVAFRGAGKTLATAEEHCRNLGELPQGKGFAALSDEDMFKIFTKLGVLFPAQVEELPILHVFYESHQVQHSPEGSERKWTQWKLRYSIAGEDTIREAVTYSSTIGGILDPLEGSEALLLTVKAGEKGDSIVSLELAAKVGGDK